MTVTDRHAYLIIAHNEPEILQTLIEIIDDVRNDIFIHIDKKSDFTTFNGISTKHSKLVYTERVNVKWGDISQVRTELILMETAMKYGNYSFFHIISGVDLPINNQDYIHETCKRINKSFVGFAEGSGNDKDVIGKTDVFHFFTKYYKNKFIHSISSILDYAQRFIGIRRKIQLAEDGTQTILKKGCNWCSLTNSAVQYILLRKENILEKFKYTICPDELFIQSVLWNSPLRNDIFGIDEKKDEYAMCMREIDWTRGDPYVWKLEDYTYLMNSKKFFARKFSSQNMDIIKKIEQTILTN